MKADGQEFRHIELSIDGGIAIITFNRPEVRNAINDAMRVEFATVLDRLSNDDAARAVVLTGKGAGFCSGGDIAGMKERLAAPAGEIAFTGWQRQKRLHQAIAILRGLVPDGGGLYLLPRRVGLARAKELIFTGRRVPAQEALAIGLIDRLTPPERLLADACEWAKQLSGGSNVALALSKAILNKTFELDEEQVLALGREAQAICYTTAEHREAVSAFLNKK